MVSFRLWCCDCCISPSFLLSCLFSPRCYSTYPFFHFCLFDSAKFRAVTLNGGFLAALCCYGGPTAPHIPCCRNPGSSALRSLQMTCVLCCCRVSCAQACGSAAAAPVFILGLRDPSLFECAHVLLQHWLKGHLWGQIKKHFCSCYKKKEELFKDTIAHEEKQQREIIFFVITPNLNADWSLILYIMSMHNKKTTWICA